MAEANDVSRRDLLKTAAAVTTVAAALPKAEGFPFIQKVRAANDQVQYGFIGTGSRGTYLLAGSRDTSVSSGTEVCMR